jgi:hypothetical protein
MSGEAGDQRRSFRRGCAARGRACRGDGARDGVGDVSRSSVMVGEVDGYGLPRE